jgi:5'-methylthioadenosine phosphorylase
MLRPALAIIGGTGLYDLLAGEDIQVLDIATPYGPTSDHIYVGLLQGLLVAFLARHGRGHRLLPSEVPYRANIWALKSLGVSQIISVSACGSMREDYAPGDIVIPDQLFDRTMGRPGTFFGDGLVAHVSLAEPFCGRLSDILCQSVRNAGGAVHQGGVYLIIEGPRFSSRGESRIYRQWGADIIGMTAVPEAQLAREAEMCYALLAHVTDYDCWHDVEEAVSVDLVIRTLKRNSDLARRTMHHLAETLRHEDQAKHAAMCPCADALRHALLTPFEVAPAATKERLRPIIAKYLPA